MRMPIHGTMIIKILLSLIMVSSHAQTNDIYNPQILIQNITSKILKIFENNEISLKKRSSIIYNMAVDVLVPIFDFKKMSMLVLGKHWKNITIEQQKCFVREFRSLLIRTYIITIFEYKNSKINFLPSHNDVSKKRARVTMKATSMGRQSIIIVLSMYRTTKGKWKVYDVKIQGISLVTNYRSVFSAEIRNSGMDGLIDSLTKHNEQG